MPKIIINSEIKSSDGKEVIKNKNAILKGGKIYFNHDNISHVITIKDDEIKLSRRNNDFDIVLEFNESFQKIGKYVLKDIGININIKTITKRLLIDKNKFKIEYEIYINGEKSDDFIYELDWREL